MFQSSLKTQATKGIIWNSVEYFSVQGGQLVINIILARLLLPSDFGLIGMLAIFIAISQTIVTSGMGTALVQKKDRTDIDYSTVFIFNVIVSVAIYFILFFSAPLVASFYKMPELVSLTRVLTLKIIINALCLVQMSRLTINLDFKTMAKVNVISVFVGGFIAIPIAYFGGGVWALVAQNLIRASSLVLLLWWSAGWIPSLKFSKQSYNDLFGFGSKLLGASLIATFFNNLYKVAIGKFFSARTLGYYTQGFQFSDITAGTVTSILQKVTFPILSSIQDDEKRMVAVYRRLIGMTSFFIFPTMTLLALLADPLIRFLLGDTWLPTIPLLQLLCFSRIIYPISALNMNILNAKGRSDLFLKVDLSKLPITIIALFITIPLGVKAVVIGHVITSIIAFFINAYLPGKLFGYGAFSQIRDMYKIILATIIMSICVFFFNMYIEKNLIRLIAGVMIGLISYLMTTMVLNVEQFREVKELLSGLLKKVKTS